MLVYTLYDYVLGEKQVITTLKQESSPRTYTLRIVTPARRFLALNFGGGFVKLSRLYDENGNLVHARHYSPELKAEIKEFKKQFQIPYFQLWKGMVYAMVIVLVTAVVFNVKNKIGNHHREAEFAKTVASLENLQNGQLYGVTFFTDKEGNSIDGLPQGWIRIQKIEGDTLFIQRSKQLDETSAIFDISKIESIKPSSESDWEEKIEKMNFPLLKKQVQQEGQNGFDVLYVGSDHEKYSGVIFTIKGTE